MESRDPRGALVVIVAGGGTGGHLFPGIAVAEALERRRPCRVVFVGAERGIENRVVPKRGYPLRTLRVRALRGLGVLETVGSAARLPASALAAWRILREERPDVVIGVGGYASAPTVAAAWARGVPTVLLEQNAYPGLTNRLLARVADRVCVAFAESRAHFPEDRTVETGNPVRPPVSVPRAEGAPFSLLVFGGSAGAHRLNEIGGEAVRRLHARGVPFRVLHQTGDADLEAVKRLYAESGVDADVRPFIEDMAAAYAAADLVLCRAGATTLAELTALGKPAILVPYPFAADDHQRKNADALVERGAAIRILDRDLEAEALASAVDELRTDPARLRRMAEAASRLGRPQAAEHVADVCLDLVDRHGRKAA